MEQELRYLNGNYSFHPWALFLGLVLPQIFSSERGRCQYLIDAFMISSRDSVKHMFLKEKTSIQSF
jgi:hypothetical protein